MQATVDVRLDIKVQVRSGLNETQTVAEIKTIARAQAQTLMEMALRKAVHESSNHHRPNDNISASIASGDNAIKPGTVVLFE